MDHDQSSQRFVRRTWSAAQARARRVAGGDRFSGADLGPPGGRGGVEGGNPSPGPAKGATDAPTGLSGGCGCEHCRIADVHRECKRLERLESAAGEIGRRREPGVADTDDLVAFEALFADGEDPAEVLERVNVQAKLLVEQLLVEFPELRAEAVRRGALGYCVSGGDGCTLDWFIDR